MERLSPTLLTERREKIERKKKKSDKTVYCFSFSFFYYDLKNYADYCRFLSYKWAFFYIYIAWDCAGISRDWGDELDTYI